MGAGGRAGSREAIGPVVVEVWVGLGAAGR